ncbi:MAG TPA: cytochrome P450 [Pyrinomonadaceae bacterium]|jgi:cytochrome P450|nr:cytochrome P450 [Pyrinomonadaceae bacterium]
MATRTHPPGPKAAVPGLQFLSFTRDPLGFLTSIARTHGDVTYFGGVAERFFFVNHPDLIKDVLVTHNSNFMKGRGLQRAKRLLGEGLLTSEPPLHRRQRRLAQPAFHKQRINAYASLMVDYALRLQRERWREGRALDVAQEMMHLTLAIVGKALFGTETEDEAEEVREALSASMVSFGRFMLPFAEVLERLPLPSMRRFRRARAQLDRIIYRIIEERRAGGEDRGDLLSMLLKAQDEEGDGGGMSDEQLRDEAMTIFLAGHETTANALAWTFYLLSQNPEAEKRLHAELDEVLSGRPPTAEDLPRLAYTEMVLAEVMRLYPPAWILGRRALVDCEVGGYKVPAGSLVILSQYVTHRDPRYFPEPERFDPERFTPEARAARPQFAYFPFGGGPRRCIGEGFAWMEGVLVIATLAREWRLRLEPGRPVEPQPVVTLRPRHGMRMTPERRGAGGGA